MNPLMFDIVHRCWVDENVRQKNGLPIPSDEQKTLIKICSMVFYYLLIKIINLGMGFLLEDNDFYNRIRWCEIDELQSKQNMV